VPGEEENSKELPNSIDFDRWMRLLQGVGPGCWFCRECKPKRCLHPLKARPAMEACGIDVYATVRANGYPTKVARHRDDIPNRYGLILID
jgi:predicted metal-binding protein